MGISCEDVGNQSWLKNKLFLTIASHPSVPEWFSQFDWYCFNYILMIWSGASLWCFLKERRQLFIIIQKLLLKNFYLINKLFLSHEVRGWKMTVLCRLISFSNKREKKKENFQPFFFFPMKFVNVMWSSIIFPEIASFDTSHLWCKESPKIFGAPGWIISNK